MRIIFFTHYFLLAWCVARIYYTRRSMRRKGQPDDRGGDASVGRPGGHGEPGGDGPGGTFGDGDAQLRERGGGRIIGEACHFVDLLRFLAGCRITGVKSTALEQGGPQEVARDTVTITLQFEDGSVGTVHYWANGTSKYPKERLQVFGGSKILVLDNFRKLKGYGWPGFKAMRSWISQDKGHAAEIEAYLHRIRKGGNPLIPFGELVETTEACFRAVESS